jgi:hypothetical protein
MLPAHLFDGSVRQSIALVFAGKVTRPFVLLQGLKDLAPGYLAVNKVIVDVEELGLNEGHVGEDIHQVRHGNGEGFTPAFFLGFFAEAVVLGGGDCPLEDTGVDEQAEVLSSGSLDESDVLVHHRVLDGSGRMDFRANDEIQLGCEIEVALDHFLPDRVGAQVHGHHTDLGAD